MSRYNNLFTNVISAESLEEAKPTLKQLEGYNHYIMSKLDCIKSQNNYLKNMIYGVAGLPGGLEICKRLVSICKDIDEVISTTMDYCTRED